MFILLVSSFGVVPLLILGLASLFDGSVILAIFSFVGVLIFVYFLPYKFYKEDIKPDLRRLKRLNERIEELEKSLSKPFSEDVEEKLNRKGLSKEKCHEVINSFKRGRGEWVVLDRASQELANALESLYNGDFDEAKRYFQEPIQKVRKLPTLKWEHKRFYNLDDDDFPVLLKKSEIIKVLSFSSRACDALYLGDVEKMRELLNEAREMLDERDKFVIGDVKFFKYLFEFHYFLLKTVVEAYEAETGAVAKLTEEQGKRFAETKPAETPQVEKATASTEEPERELYRGEVRFKMGAMSQERVGTLVITNKRLKLTGKYRLRGTVATVAVKAALRAAGIGEVYEDIPLNEISWLELKKALFGGYYLEFRARGKKFTLYTDAAQHIYNLLKQHGSA